MIDGVSYNPLVLQTQLRKNLTRQDGVLQRLATGRRINSGKDDPAGLIAQGNEWVIGARLTDASFFFEEDRKRPLEDPLGGERNVKELLGIPEHLKVLAVVALGHPAEEKEPVPAADLPWEKVHRNRFS